MASDTPRICVVGSSNIDLTFRSPSLPRTGQTLAGTGFQLGHGGKGANQAVMAARLGAKVTMVSKLGRDVFGEGYLRQFRAEGIDTTHVRMADGVPSGVAFIGVDDDARNCIIVVPGANGAFTAEDVRSAAEAIRAADLVLAQLEVPVAATVEAFRLAREAGVHTLLNPAPAQELPDELFRLTDYCIPNETEIEALTGRLAGTVEQAGESALTLCHRGPKTVIITLGERGAVVATEGKWFHAPAPAVTAVDTSGAGDAFIGALAVFLAEGLALDEAVRRANLVAARSVTRAGTQASFPRRRELDFG